VNLIGLCDECGAQGWLYEVPEGGDRRVCVDCKMGDDGAEGAA